MEVIGTPDSNDLEGCPILLAIECMFVALIRPKVYEEFVLIWFYWIAFNICNNDFDFTNMMC